MNGTSGICEAGEQKDGISKSQARRRRSEVEGGRRNVQPRSSVLDVKLEELTLQSKSKKFSRGTYRLGQVGKAFPVFFSGYCLEILAIKRNHEGDRAFGS